MGEGGRVAEVLRVLKRVRKSRLQRTDPTGRIANAMAFPGRHPLDLVWLVCGRCVDCGVSTSTASDGIRAWVDFWRLGRLGVLGGFGVMTDQKMPPVVVSTYVP